MAEGYKLLRGEFLRGVRGELVASFQLDSDGLPALGEVQRSVEKQVLAEAPRYYEDMDDFCLADWRGGWRGDAAGHWEADILGLRDATWHVLGRVIISVLVRGDRTLI